MKFRQNCGKMVPCIQYTNPGVSESGWGAGKTKVLFQQYSWIQLKVRVIKGPLHCVDLCVSEVRECHYYREVSSLGHHAAWLLSCPAPVTFFCEREEYQVSSAIYLQCCGSGSARVYVIFEASGSFWVLRIPDPLSLSSYRTKILLKKIEGILK